MKKIRQLLQTAIQMHSWTRCLHVFGAVVTYDIVFEKWQHGEVEYSNDAIILEQS